MANEGNYMCSAILIFFKQIRVFVVFCVESGRRTVHQQNVPFVCEHQYSFDIVRMQFTDLIHHAMDSEISELTGSPFLEHIDKHNVDHCLYKYVRSI